MSNATESTYASIRRAIMAGRYTPGTQLKEEHLAEQMGVSRTPVRSALQRLVADQLLRAANRGVFVAEWTEQDIFDVFELRLLLEPYAAGLAAANATARQIEEMRVLTDRMESYTVPFFRGNLQEIQEENHSFHNLILRASGSERLKNIASGLTDMPMVIGSFYFYTEEDMQHSIHYHRQLIAAIEAREPVFASAVMALHLRVTHSIFVRNRKCESRTAAGVSVSASHTEKESAP